MVAAIIIFRCDIAPVVAGCITFSGAKLAGIITYSYLCNHNTIVRFDDRPTHQRTANLPGRIYVRCPEKDARR